MLVTIDSSNKVWEVRYMSRKFWDGDTIPPSGPERAAWFRQGFKSTASLNFLDTPVGEWDSDKHYAMPKKQKDNRPRKTDKKKAPYRVASAEWESNTGIAWMGEAACADTGFQTFLPIDLRHYKNDQAWRPFCDSCPVAKQCLQYGRESGSQGVWGGVYIDSHMRENDIETLEQHRG